MSKRSGNKYRKKRKMTWEGIKATVGDLGWFFESKYHTFKMLVGKEYRVHQRGTIMKKILNEKWYEKYQEQERKRGNIE